MARTKIKDRDKVRAELKRIYCTTPELIQKLRSETANHRNAFIPGDIEDSFIEVNQEEREIE